MSHYESRLTHTREDALCNRLIDLYEEEKHILHSRRPRLALPNPVLTASLTAIPVQINPQSATIQELNALFVTAQQMAMSAADIIKHPSEQGLVIGLAAACVGLSAARFLNKEKMAEIEEHAAQIRDRRLEQIDLERYTITYENPGIFGFAHHIYAETPDLYRKWHLKP